MSDPSLVELTVEDIAAGGEGIARLDSGRVVFVPRTAPGDRVLARLTEDRARWARGRVIEWRKLGRGRATPSCPYFDACGGCQTQHLDTATQTAALERAVGDALVRIGGVAVPVAPLVSGARRFEYRNRITLHVRRTPTVVIAGYHALRGPELVDAADCPLAEPAVRAAWRGLRGAWGARAAHLPAGRELRVTLRASRAGQVALLVAGGSHPGEPEALAAGVPGLASYWWQPTRGARRRLAGSAVLEDEWDGVSVALRPRAFLQVNREVARALEMHLDARLGALAGLRILDLYAGVGLRALRWARGGARVTAVEAEPDAVETGREAAARTGAPLDFVMGRVEAVLDARLPADVVVLNPPRGGVHRAVAERLSHGSAERLVYVSCDPATLARDVRALGPGWVPELAQPFDAFPQTGHVETVLWLRRAGVDSTRPGGSPSGLPA